MDLFKLKGHWGWFLLTLSMWDVTQSKQNIMTIKRLGLEKTPEERKLVYTNVDEPINLNEEHPGRLQQTSPQLDMHHLFNIWYSCQCVITSAI